MDQQFVKFTFSKITTELNAKGIEKKNCNNMPKWKEITRDNYTKYIKPQHTAHAIITGEISNISGFDFDNKNSYNTRSGGEQNSIRVPSLKRSDRVWRNFYNLFPFLKDRTSYRGCKLKKLR